MPHRPHSLHGGEAFFSYQHITELFWYNTMMNNIYIMFGCSLLGLIDMEIYKKLQHQPEAPLWLGLIAVSTMVLIASVFKVIENQD